MRLHTQHPSVQRRVDAVDQLTTNLDRSVRNQAIVQAAKLVSDEVPLLPLYYNYDVRAHAASLRGPQAYAPGGEATWSVEQWEIKYLPGGASRPGLSWAPSGRGPRRVQQPIA